MQQHSISVQRTAHYSTIGQPGPKVKYLIIACHGYGQLAKRFIRKFDVLDPEEVLVIAPEGLSRFYWGGLDGDVVASWMTREDRLDEIEDFCNYLQNLYDYYLPQLSAEVKVVLLGFSQGCATIMRWVMRDFPKCDYLSFWGGMIPEDLDYKPHLDYFKEKDITFFRGEEDPLITPDRLTFIRQVILETGIKGIKEIPFEGKHTVERSVLKNWYDTLA